MSIRANCFLWIAVVSQLILIGCKPADPYFETPISGPVSLENGNVAVFRFDKPFKPTRQVVEVCFAYTDNRIYSENVLKPPKFGDGTTLEITASLVSEEGKEYPLGRIASSERGYLCLYPELSDEWIHISESTTTFVALRATSNVPVKLDRIEWLTFNMWDL